MYDFKIRCLFQSIYAIFFNKGTMAIKASLQLLKKGDNPNVNAKILEQMNTGIGYIIMLMTVISKISRVNYSCMYKFFGSRSCMMIKDKSQATYGTFIEGRGIVFSQVKVFLDSVCRDAVRILEFFRVSIREIHAILSTADLHRYLETFKSCLFKKVFCHENLSIDRMVSATTMCPITIPPTSPTQNRMHQSTFN